MPSSSDYEVVIGIEVHVQLKTLSKMFCRCRVDVDAPPNTNVCPICLGLPGVLPAVNRKALSLGIKAGLALGCEINPISRWARKHYFSPDLPKGYQITQYRYPLAERGALQLPGKEKRIRIRRLHLEEDAGKLIHASRQTLVDFNRCGVPLAEIVTEPDITSAEEADAYLKELREILVSLGVSDARMQLGHFRCEPNISVRPKGEEKLGVRSEIKNLNSFKAVREGIKKAVGDQIKLLEKGEEITQTTYLWDEKKRELKPMRAKETAADYRYFPEPDLPAVQLTEEDICKVKSHIGELPSQRRERLGNAGLEPQDAEILSREPEWEAYFSALLDEGVSAKEASAWLLNEARGLLSERGEGITQFKVDPGMMGELIELLRQEKLTRPAAKELLARMASEGKGARKLMKELGLESVSDEGLLESTAREVIEENPGPVKRYLEGKQGVIGFLIGQCMKKLRDKADPNQVRAKLKEILSKKG